MDPTQLAVAAAAMLAPYLAEAGKTAAKEAGETAWETVTTLYQAIRRKFAAEQDGDAAQTLESLEAKPNSPAREAALAEVLADKAQADPAFASELADLVRHAGQDPGVTQFLTNVYGQARVKNILNIGQAGDLTIK